MPEGRHEAVQELTNCFESVWASFNEALLAFCCRLIDLALDFRPFPLSTNLSCAVLCPQSAFFSLGLNKECAAVLAGLQLPS